MEWLFYVFHLYFFATFILFLHIPNHYELQKYLPTKDSGIRKILLVLAIVIVGSNETKNDQNAVHRAATTIIA